MFLFSGSSIIQNINATFNYVVNDATHRQHLAPLRPLRVSDDEDGDGLTFGGKQHLRVANFILLDTTQFIQWY